MHPVIIAGLLVGVLDILAAFAVGYGFRGSPPSRVLQGIASGLLGPPAFTGGTATAALGLFLHFVIAFAVAGVYYAVSRWWRLLVERPFLVGLLYGVAVYWMMNAIVLPLSRLPRGPRPAPLSVTFVMIVIHMVFVGLPTSLTIARSRRR